MRADEMLWYRIFENLKVALRPHDIIRSQQQGISGAKSCQTVKLGHLLIYSKIVWFLTKGKAEIIPAFGLFV